MAKWIKIEEAKNKTDKTIVGRIAENNFLHMFWFYILQKLDYTLNEKKYVGHVKMQLISLVPTNTVSEQAFSFKDSAQLCSVS